MIGRGLETALLAEVAAAVKRQGGRELLASFVPGPRNALCAQFLPQHGFDRRSGEHEYTFPFGQAAASVAPIAFSITWNSK